MKIYKMTPEKLELYQEIIRDYNTGNFKLKDLAEKYNITYAIISKHIRKMGCITSPHGKISVNSSIFKKINSEEHAYWLGFLYADGSIYRKKGNTNYTLELGLQEKDLGHIDKFKNFISSKHNIKYRKDTKSYRLSFNDKELCEDLINLGCIPNKSLILIFPTEEQVPKELLRHFIRGYFDGDGYFSKPPKAITAGFIGTYEFLNSLLEILQNIGIKKKTLKKDKRHLNNTFFFTLSGNDARNFIKYCYKDSNISLNRKHELINIYKLKLNE